MSTRPASAELRGRRCDQELCPNWSGDGNVCPCAIFDLPRREDDDDAY